MFAENLVFSIFLIFTGAALFATLMLLTRQSMLVAYVLVGVLIGPWGLKLINDASVIKQIGEVGIIFLLFLVGLHLEPKNLINMFRNSLLVAGGSSVIFVLLGYLLGILLGLPWQESLTVGAALMFSSTIIGLKLLPTTVLHHQHTGEIIISVLLLQDLIAILVLMLLHSAVDGFSWYEIVRLIVGVPGAVIFAFLVERWVLMKLFRRFDKIQEYVFLVSLGWCLGMGELTHALGLSTECGAFIAGVVLAEGPIALFIAESLKPLRDFFLVMFFFAIGASFNLEYLMQVLPGALLLSAFVIVAKPMVFAFLLKYTGEASDIAWEVGWRLGQASEFSIMVAYIAAGSALGLIDENASYLIQATSILTFIISSYIIVWRFPTPMALSDRMRRD